MASVVLAAVAEIEQFTRIRHDITDAVYVAGHAVADLVHLVAELLENATIFSPPDTAVSVFGWASPDGDAVLMIQDAGIGMSADAVALVNRQLGAPASIDVAAAERMGLVVVAHLAARHRIRVEIRRTTPGVAAYVLLPAALLAEAPADAMELPALAGAPRHAWALQSGPTAVESGREAEELPEGAGLARRSVPTRAEDVLGAAQRDGGSVWWSRGGAGAAGKAPEQRRARGAVSSDAAPDGDDGVLAATASTGDGAMNGDRAAYSDRATNGDRATDSEPAPNGDRPLSGAARPDGTSNGGTSAGGGDGLGPAGLPVRVPMAQLPDNQLKSAAASSPKPAEAEPDPTHVGSVLSRFYGGVHRAAAEDESSHT
jgi:hypothetical protein